MGEKAGKILALYGVTQYGALNYFLYAMVDRWIKAGMDVQLMPNTFDLYSGKAENVFGGFDRVISMNGMGLEFQDDRVLADRRIKAPWYAYYVDHPLHHGVRLERTGEKDVRLFSDPTFAAYADRYYQGRNYVVMQAGMDRGLPVIPYKKRKQSVVFFGTFTDSAARLQQIHTQTDGVGKLNQILASQGLIHTNWEMEHILEYTLSKLSIDYSDEEFLGLMEASDSVELFLRGKFREDVLRVLLSEGIRVDVYGDGWDKFDCDGKENLVCHPPVDYMDMLQVMEDAKVVLNVMPWSKGGVHDRLLNAMLSGALVLSDTTTYLMEQEKKYHHLLLYELSDVRNAAEKLADYLENEDEAEAMAMRGYEWAKAGHTWEHRADQILDIWMGGEDDGV